MMLNDAQSAAAETLSGLVLVDAGAGSGKTRALTQRFVNGVDPTAGVPGWNPTTVERIVAITFTDKAAGELADRIRETLRAQPDLQDQARRVDVAWISTIHGFCSRLLRENALVAGLDPQFGVADTVTVGELSEETFEAAARDVIGRLDHAERLFAEYGYGQVFSAVTSIRRELIKRGSGTDALALEPTVDAAALLHRAIGVLQQAAGDLEDCDDARRGVVDGIGRCHDVARRLSCVDATRMAAADIGRAVWAELRTVPKSAGIRSGVAAELLGDLVAERATLRREALALALKPLGEALLAVVAEYSRRFDESKAERSLLDFDDLQTQTLRLLTEHPKLASAYREQFSLVMVDEFQDTDSLQLALVRAFAGPNLCTVGDEWQSIYRFRGAEIEVYREHRDAAVAKGVRPIEFTLNYRSHADVLRFVNRVFGAPEYFGDGLLRLEHGREELGTPMLPDGEPRIEILVVDRPTGTTDVSREREAAEVADRFAWLRDEHGVDPSGMTVLVRAWSRANVFAEALRARGFAVIVGGGDFLTRPEVRLARSLMAVIANPHDEQSLATVLASPLGGVSASALWIIAARRAEDGTGMWESVVADHDEFSAEDSLALRRIVSAISNARGRVGSMPLAEIILRTVTELAYDLVLLSKGLEGKQQFVNVLKVARLAEAFEVTGQTGMAGFVEHLDVKEKLGDRESIASLADDGSPAVRIMSIHGAKGLEFRVVAVVGLADGTGSDTRCVRTGWSADREQLRVALRAANHGDKDDVDRTAWFEAQDAADRAAEQDEEKRLAYVAVTRAREYLLLSGGLRVNKLVESSSTIATVFKALGRAGSLEPGVDGTVDIAGLPVRLRCVEAATLDREVDRRVVEAHRLREATLVLDTRAGTPPEGGATVEEVSFSALKTYLTCPRRYWSERVARLGRVEDGRGVVGGDVDSPPADDPLAFGSAVHAALEESAGCGLLSAGRLDALAALFRLGEAGRMRLERAVKAVSSSAAMAEARRLGTARVEVPFTLALGEGANAVRLAGAIDLYARDERHALIIDYKTGTTGGADEIRERYGLQARCYALAALAEGAEQVDALYVRPEVRAGDDIETTRFGPFCQGDIPELEAEVMAIVHRIRSGEFPPQPSQDACRECAIPRGLCPEAFRAP